MAWLPLARGSSCKDPWSWLLPTTRRLLCPQRLVGLLSARHGLSSVVLADPLAGSCEVGFSPPWLLDGRLPVVLCGPPPAGGAVAVLHPPHRSAQKVLGQHHELVPGRHGLRRDLLDLHLVAAGARKCTL